jgi:hypothetical protein
MLARRRAGLVPALLALVMLTVLTMFPAAVSASDEAAAAPARPNIVVIVADDLPRLDGRWWSFLPQIRSAFFGESATRFFAAHSETPLCCPGRAGLLSGQPPGSTG